MGELLDTRRRITNTRFEQFRRVLTAADQLCLGKACVYATGSFARGEATEYSDLDLFIVGRTTDSKRDLRRLEEIRIKADLIEMTERFHIPEFSGDGQYLEHYTVDDLVKTLGKPEDDLNNTFTARLLLLLESRPLLGEAVYDDIIDEVISKYWEDYEDNKNEFIPAFLANDILRLWRTFCVNYEARTSRKPDEKRAKRKLKNFKLKHSRLLTCYSALLYLLAIYSQENTVSPQHAAEMIALTPTGRLEWISAQPAMSKAREKIIELIGFYEAFLRETDDPEYVLVKRFLDSKSSRLSFASAHKLGDIVFELMEIIGKKDRLHRLLVV